MSNTPLKLRKTVVPISFGIEIEGRNSRLRTKTYDHIGFFFITTDGSLGYSNSIELVSQPLPPKMLIRCLETMKKRHGEISSEDSAGIHIHVTKTPKVEKRMIELYNWIRENRERWVIQNFFGRNPNLYCRAHWDMTAVRFERYSAINFRNEHTIEVRLFGNNDPTYNGIESGVCFIKRLNAVLSSKETITTQFMETICSKYPRIPT